LFETAGLRVITPDTLHAITAEVVQNGMVIVLPFAVTLLTLGVLATVIQTGPIWIEDGLQPKISKLNPVTGLKRIFSLRGVMELLKSVIKLAIIAGMAYFIIRAHITEIVEIPGLSVGEAFQRVGRIAFLLVMAIGLVLLVLALADFVYQRWQFMKDQRMTKQEVKDEMKDVEGNPLTRSRRMSLQRDRARERMMQAVPNADVVITNPTHLAVALKYDPEQSEAPMVLAKGAGYVAEHIKQVARSASIPIVENKPVAQGLYKLVEVGRTIPTDLYKAVAEILAYVYRLKQGYEEVAG
jgi:flagellar biosynthetic protein FlhB